MEKDTNSNEGFINETDLEFKDISSELQREYIKYDKVLKIDGEPLYLNVSPSGGHRLYTSTGWCYYIQPKEAWAIRWKSKKGKPNFVK